MTSIPTQWRVPLLALALAWALLTALYFDTGAAMVHIWDRSETFAHAWVVPPLAIWLVWRRRTELARLTPRPALRWFWLLPPLGLLWLAGDVAAVQAATQFALVGMGVVLVPILLGTTVAGCLAFPLGFLFFAVPFGDFLTPWLVEHTADFTVFALRASGIPVFREATQFVIPSGSWSVVEACSGIRYLMASIMVGTLFAYLNYRSARKRWAFVCVAIIVPLVANWLRAYLIVMLAHLSDNKLATGVDHIIYGWVFFGIIMLVMFMIGVRWADNDAEPALAAPPAVSSDVAPRRVAAVLAGALLLVVLPTALRVQLEQADKSTTPSIAVPALSGWTWSTQPLSSWDPNFRGAAATLHGRYTPDTGGPAVGVFIGYYRHQRYGHQLITSTNGLVGGEERQDDSWARTASGRTELDAQPWRTAELRGQALSQVTGSGEPVPRLRVWLRYWIDGRVFTSDWQAKIYGAWRKLLGQGDDAAVIIIYADKSAAEPDDALLRGFVHHQWPALSTALQGVRDDAAASRP